MNFVGAVVCVKHVRQRMIHSLLWWQTGSGRSWWGQCWRLMPNRAGSPWPATACTVPGPESTCLWGCKACRPGCRTPLHAHTRTHTHTHSEWERNHKTRKRRTFLSNAHGYPQNNCQAMRVTKWWVSVKGKINYTRAKIKQCHCHIQELSINV